jgi:hypothetical protein
MPELPRKITFVLNFEFLEDRRTLFRQTIRREPGQTFNNRILSPKQDYCNFFFQPPTSALASAARGVLK